MQYTFVTKFVSVDFERTLYNSVILRASSNQWEWLWKNQGTLKVQKFELKTVWIHWPLRISNR